MTIRRHLIVGVMFISLISTAVLLSSLDATMVYTVVTLLTIIIALSASATLLVANIDSRSGYFSVVAVAFGFLALIDLLRTVTHPGMSAITGLDHQLSLQLWIAGRVLESVALLVAVLFAGRRLPVVPSVLVIGTYASLVIAVTIVFPLLPALFNVIGGPTPFRIVSHLLVFSIFIATAAVARRSHLPVDAYVLRLIQYAVWLSAAAEIAVAFSGSVTALGAIIGHAVRLVSVVLIAGALIEQTVRRPLRTVFGELKRTESSLRRSEAVHRLVLENLQEGIWAVDDRGITTYINRQAAGIVGQAAGKIVGRSFSDYCAQPLEMVSEKICSEVTIDRPDGSEAFVHLTGGPLNDADGSVQGALVSMVDLTGQRQISDSHALLAQAVAQASDSIVIIGVDGKIKYANPAFSRATGYSESQAVGNTPVGLARVEHTREIYEKIWQTVSSGQDWKGHIPHQRDDGAAYDEEASVSRFFDQRGRIIGYIAVSRDITHELQLQQHALSSQKLEAIGTLAGGIAHDFNNILMAILSYAQIASLAVDPCSPAIGHLQQIEHAGKRARDLVDQILTFSRGSQGEHEPTDLCTVIREAARMLRATTPATTEIVTRLPDGLPPVSIDPSQMLQVIMNLGVNAAHAVEECSNGRIELCAAFCSSVEQGASPRLAQAAQLSVEVTDNGVGMSAEVVSRLFEPFFTTKPAGKGSGMGLPVVHGIVTAAGGVIDVESSCGQGTTIRIYFPALENEGSARSYSNLRDLDAV